MREVNVVDENCPGDRACLWQLSSRCRQCGLVGSWDVMLGALYEAQRSHLVKVLQTKGATGLYHYYYLQAMRVPYAA